MVLTPEQKQDFIKRNQMYAAPQNAYLAQVAQMPQEQAVKVLRLSMQAGIDPVEAARNPMATVQTLIGASDFEDVGKFAPKTYSFLQDPMNMAIVNDKRNVMTLADLESENKVWTAAKNGLKGVVRSALGSLQSGFDVVQDEQKKQPSDSIAYQLARVFTPVGALSNEAVGNQVRSLVNSERLQRKDVKADTVVGQYGLDVVETVPQIAAQVSAYYLTGGAGSMGFMASQIAGSEYLKLRDEGVATDRAFQAGWMDAAAQAPLESLSLNRLFKRFPGASSLRQKLVEIGKGTLTEAITEWMQQYPEAAIEIWARHPEYTPEQRSEQFINDFWEITKEGAYQGLVAAPFGLLGGAVKVSVEKQAAKDYVEHLERKQAIIAQSPLKNISPEVMEKHDAYLETDKVYIEPDQLMVLYQQGGEPVLDKLGLVVEDVEAAAQTGQLVAVPESVYNLAAVQDGSIHAALKDDIAFDEEGITLRRVNARSEREIAEAMREDDQRSRAVRRESDRIFQQWTGAGMPKQEARDALTLLVSNAYLQSDNPVEFLREKAPLMRRQKTGSKPGALHQYAGESALTADRLKLQEAQDLEVSGEDAGPAGTVRQKTGWHRGQDNKWRFEIDDSQASLIDVKGLEQSMTGEISGILSKAKKVKDTTARAELESQADTLIAQLSRKKAPLLGNVLEHPSLYQAYPWIKSVKVVFSRMKAGDNGSYDPAINTIEINNSLSSDEQKATLLHEVQHVIQEQEGFAPGGNPASFEDLDVTDQELERIQTELDGIIEEKPELRPQIERAWQLEAMDKAEITEAENNELDDIYDAIYNNPNMGEWAKRLAKKEDELKRVAETGSVLTAFEQYQRLHGEIEARDTASRAGLSAAERLAMPPDSRPDAIISYNGREYAYRSASEINPKGYIYWGDDGRAVITMLEHADASTVIHELVGHYMTQNLLDNGAVKDAPEWMKQDRQTVLDYVGIADWATATQEEKEAAHEKMAEAAEAYILEGKSPSQALAGVFRRFAEWLTAIYREVRRAEIDLKPEIRAVFDRMLASQEEIEHMQMIKEYNRRMPQEVLDTLSDQQRAWLEKSLANVEEQAKDVLRGRVLKQFSREQKEKIQEEMDRVRPEIEEETAKEPVYQAMEELRKQSGGRNPRSIANDYLLDHNSTETVGMELIAEQYGFTSADHMMKAIAGSKDWINEVKARIDRHIENTFGDIYERKELLHQEAEQALFNEDGATLLAIENEILLEKLGKVITREEQQKETIRQRMIASEIAQATIAKMPVDKAMNLMPFVTAYRRAAEKSRAALIKKDYTTAQKEKQIQLLNHAMVMESVKARREYERLNRYFTKEKGVSKDTWRKETHFIQAAALLSRFGYIAKSYDPTARTESLAQWAERMNEVMDSVSIADWLFNENGYINPRKLRLVDLQDIENALRNIKKIAQTEDEFLVLAGKQQIEEIIDEAETRLALKEDVYNPEAEASKEEARKGFWRGFYRGSEKVTTILAELDKWKDFGFFDKLLYEPVYKKQNDLSNMMHELKNNEQLITNELFSKEEQKDLWKKVYYPELNASVSKRFLLEMASHTGTASNQKALFGAVPVGLSKSSLWVKNEKGKVDYAASSNKIMAFLQSNLTEKDWKWVQAGWDNINSLWPKANEVHKQQSGFSMKKVKATPFSVTLQDGRELELRGGYYPLKEDRRARSVAERRDEERQGLFTANAQLFTPKTFTGYTKERTNAAYSVDLNPANRYRHMQSVAHDINFRPVITDLRRLLTNDRFKGLLERKMGPEGYNAILDFVAAAATPETKASSTGQKALDTIANGIRERAMIASLMFNMKTALQNLANPFLFGGVVEGFTHRDASDAFMNRGVFDYWAKAISDREGFKNDRDFVLSKSAFMRDKMEAPDFIFHEFQQQMQGEENKIVKWGGMLLAETDNLSNIPMWREAYEKKLAAGESEVQAVRFADTLIDRTSGSGRKIDTASFLRGNSVTRLLTMFQTFMNTQFNGWIRERGIFLRERDYARLTAAVGARFLLFSMASIFLSGDQPDDDKEKYWMEWAYKVFSYPMQLLPIVGTLANTAMGYMLGVQTFGYKLSPVEGHIERLARAIGTVPAVLDGRKEPEALAEAVTSAAAFVAPYPDQFNRWFWNAFDIVLNDMEPEVGDLIRRRPSKER